MSVYELIREDIVLNLEARVDSQGEGISGGDTARHGGSGDSGGCGVGERERKEGRKGGCDSGEKGFRSSVKEDCFFFFFFPSFLSAIIACVFKAI